MTVDGAAEAAGAPEPERTGAETTGSDRTGSGGGASAEHGYEARHEATEWRSADVRSEAKPGGKTGGKTDALSDDWADVTNAVPASVPASESEWGSASSGGGYAPVGPGGLPFAAEPSSETTPPPPEEKPKKTGLALAAAPFAAVWRFAFPKKPRPFLVELPFLLAIALILAFLIKTFLVQAFVIPSGSMQNTLEINDRVLVNRFANWMGDEPGRGDVVVFQDPGGWLESSPVKPKNLVGKTLTAVGLLPEDNGDLIKRVIGVPGDHVTCAGPGNPVMVNGVALNEPYIYPGNQPSMYKFDVTVPAGHLWVMGDHRDVSEDSRPHNERNPGSGYVPIKDVVGIAIMKVWPPSRFGTLPLPATFTQKGINALSTAGAVPVVSVALALPVTLVRRRRKLRDLG